MKKIVKFIKKNAVVSMFIGIFAFLLLVMIIFLIIKKGTFSLDDNALVVDCQEPVIAGETFECNLSLMMNDDTKIYSINANYNFGDNVEYESFAVESTECTGEGCLEPLEATENGFAVVSVDGFVGSILFGKLRVTVPTAEPNSTVTIGLNNIELSFDDNGEVSDEMLELADVTVTSRVANNVATISKIFIDDVELQEFPLSCDAAFCESADYYYEKQVDANVSSVNLTYILNDENATVSGTGAIETLPLHYGKNVYYLDVTSEDGSVTTTYVINIVREYEFSTSVYTYNEADNYIYTRTDTGTVIISNIEEPTGNVSYHIKDNNKLAVVYGENDELLLIDIINFVSTYEIVNNKIHIANNLTRDSLISSFTLNGVVIKLFDENNNEITDGSRAVTGSDKVNVYYGSTLLDSFTLDMEFFRINEALTVDEQKMLITKLKLGTTYGQFKNNFVTSGRIEFVDNDGITILGDDDILKSGDVVKIILSNNTYSYTLSVLGDINGDGVVWINDVGALFRFYRNKITLQPAYAAAGDVVDDGVIWINDVGKLFRYMRGKIDSLGGDEDE